MKLPDNDYQILQLSSLFYLHYKSPPYQEILRKNNRPYNCLLFQTHYDYYICIPYRTEISHSYIKKQALQYVEDYIAHIQGTNPLSYQEFNRRYNYSTLKYFIANYVFNFQITYTVL